MRTISTLSNEGVEWRNLLALRADPTTGEAALNRPVGWDTDGDGMPDTWEIAHGLNPNVANNNGDFDNDFYTDLEEYLNEIAAWPSAVWLRSVTNGCTGLLRPGACTLMPVMRPALRL